MPPLTNGEHYIQIRVLILLNRQSQLFLVDFSPSHLRRPVGRNLPRLVTEFHPCEECFSVDAEHRFQFHKRRAALFERIARSLNFLSYAIFSTSAYFKEILN